MRTHPCKRMEEEYPQCKRQGLQIATSSVCLMERKTIRVLHLEGGGEKTTEMRLGRCHRTVIKGLGFVTEGDETPLKWFGEGGETEPDFHCRKATQTAVRRIEWGEEERRL